MLGPLALKAWDAMWKLYDRKYGKYGELAVRKLKRALAERDLEIDHLKHAGHDLQAQIATLEATAKEATKEAERYRDKYNEAQAIIAARDGGVRPVDADPYEEG